MYIFMCVCMYIYIYIYIYISLYMYMYFADYIYSGATRHLARNIYLALHGDTDIRYGVATMSRMLKNTGLFAEYRSLL